VSNITTKPFIEISIVSLNDDDSTKKEIFASLQTRLSKIVGCDVFLLNKGDDSSLRIEFPSSSFFYETYQREFDLYEYIIQLYNHDKNNFDKIFPVVHHPPNPMDPNFYLILKYLTSDKEPLRKNYQFTQWFAEKFDEQWIYEETENGFLHFYRRKEDFLNSNLNKCDLNEMSQYLQNKQLKIMPEVLERMKECIKKNKRKNESA